MATLFFKWLYPRSVIHCFEPDRPTFEMLRRNVQANHLTDVHPHNVALSDVVGAVEFFVSASRNGSPPTTPSRHPRCRSMGSARAGSDR